ncbi:MAG: hypothetical protein GOVbin2604_31 [Gammaproteobacteria virus GOV_bin_2604]|nr:MAG: hypothetical protein GOVbin2604_31 [Gammaproteobacteria virus GOV_bin_2604]|tara:strand:+ start:5947 stop:6231 length:285 start_codon:yes stop_codon:yes gene_type:complete
MNDIGLSVGSVIVSTTKNSGHSAEYWAEQATNKIIQYSDNIDPVLQQQAKEFKNNIYTVVLDYMKKAVQSDRSTLIYTLEKEGHKCGSDIIRRL